MKWLNLCDGESRCKYPNCPYDTTKRCVQLLHTDAVAMLQSKMDNKTAVANEQEIITALEQGVKHQVCKDRSFRFDGMTREYCIPDLLYEVMLLLKEQSYMEEKG